MAQPLPIKAVNHVGRSHAARRRKPQVLSRRARFSRGLAAEFRFSRAWLYNYGIMIHLIYNEAAGDPQGEIQTRYDHLALHCDDLAVVERLLDEHGVKYRKNVVADRGIAQIFFRDPDGHHVEIGTYPPTPAFV